MKARKLAKVEIVDQEGVAEIYINGFRVVEVTARLDEQMVEIHVYDTKGICHMNMAFEPYALGLLEE